MSKPISKTGTCCFCGKHYENFGNNPHPLSKSKKDRCCDECDQLFVLPARLADKKTFPLIKGAADVLKKTGSLPPYFLEFKDNHTINYQ